MHERILSALAVFSQLLALYPFVVLTDGIGFSDFVWWHYAAMYGVIGAFYCFGRLLGSWAFGGGFSGKVKPVVMFIARTGFVLPAVLFCIVCVAADLHTGLYLYLLPGCIAAYYGGYLSTGKGYSDIFTRGWFGAYFVAAIIAALLLGFTRDKALVSSGMIQLCASFGVMIIASAILTNQTNIDVQTRQRGGGRAVLPKGTRSYNAWLIGAVGALVVGLCLFTKPVAEGIMYLIKLLLKWLLSLAHSGDEPEPEDVISDENNGGAIDYPVGDNILAQLLWYLFLAAGVFLAIKFRRQIWGLIKEVFSPLFKVPVLEEQAPFVDEFSASADTRASSKELRRNERELLKRYRRETDPVLKYRAGYELFLIRLGGSAFPRLPTDTTTAHNIKGDKAFSARLPGRLAGMVSVYDRVRYGGEVPDGEELEQLDRILRQIGI